MDMMDKSNPYFCCCCQPCHSSSHCCSSSWIFYLSLESTLFRLFFSHHSPFFLCLFNALNSYIKVILDRSLVFSKEWIVAWNLSRTAIRIFLTILESENSKPCNLTYLQCWEVYWHTLESWLFDLFIFCISNPVTRFHTSRLFIFSFPSHSSLRKCQIPNADF